MTEQPRYSDATAGSRGRAAGGPWSPGSPAAPHRSARRTIASFDRYEDAERAIDRPSDLGFPVERVAIIGQDLQTVEQVTGKMDYPRAAWRGALSGAVPGALIGWIFGLFSWVNPLITAVLLALYGAVIGAVIGAIIGVITEGMPDPRGRPGDAGAAGGVVQWPAGHPVRPDPHLVFARDDVVPRTPQGCEDCLRIGSPWVHLRLCLTCRHVGCCDSSRNRHARAHAGLVGHPIVRSFEPGEDWRWCFADEAFA